MIKKILLIDDEPGNWLIVDMLKDTFNGVEVYIGRDLFDADGYILDDGIEFDAMIIDFALGEYAFTDERDIAAFSSMRKKGTFLVGWIWIKSFLRDHPNYNPKAIIGLSAYTDLLSKEEIRSSGICVIDKQDRESENLLLRALAAL